MGSQYEIDLRKRNFFKRSAFLFSLPPTSVEKTRKTQKPKDEKLKSFFSEIVGDNLVDDDVKRILQTIEKIRSEFTKVKIEKLFYFLSLLPKKFFYSQKRFFKKFYKVLFIFSKLVAFSYYSTDRAFTKIGYSGPARGKIPPSQRSDDPEISPSSFSSSDKFSFDVCIIGSGAAGSITALSLSEKFSVCILEKGKLIYPRDFSEREDEMIPKLYRISFSSDFSVIALSGKCVGGSTVHNTALFVKIPKNVFEFWEHLGLPIKYNDFEGFSDTVFSICSAEKIAEHDLNSNALFIKMGMEKLGVKFFLPYHARKGCLKVGFCELGCYWNKKFSSLLNILPRAQRFGAKIFPESEVLYFEHDGKRVKSAVVRWKGEIKRVRAKYFVLSASSLVSPLILKRSFGLDSTGLCLHPSTYVIGLFDENIDGWLGIPISLISDEFLEPDRGFILMPYFMHPSTISLAVGGIGRTHGEIMRKYRNLACVSVLVHDRSSGRVGEKFFDYKLDSVGFEDIKRGIFKGAEIMFSAGAREVILPHIFSVRRAKSMSDVERFLSDISVYDIPIVSVHPQASLSWQNFLDEEGRLKGLENLWVCDASVFPSSCGVPPQVSVMAFSLFVSSRIMAKEKTS